MEIRVVRYRQSGGFAGLIRGAEMDGGDLSDAERRALMRAMQVSATSSDVVTRDHVVHELELDTDSGTRRLTFDESGAPAGLEGLLDRLASRAKPIPLR